jgi:hypothetical protein
MKTALLEDFINEENTFNILSLNPLLWLDATDSSTLTNDGGGLISQWRDKSGNANHANATGAGRPTLTIGVQNGLNVIRFVAPNLMTLTNRLNLTGEYTIFTVLSRRVVTGTRMYLGDETTDIKIGHTVPSTARHFVRAVSSGSNDQNELFPFAQNAFGIITLSRDSSNKIDYRVNDGSPVRLFANVAQAGSTFFNRIGNDNLGTSAWNGDIAEMIIVNTNTTSVNLVVSYLKSKFNL